MELIILDQRKIMKPRAIVGFVRDGWKLALSTN
jgi:hypothetical protein